MKNAASVVVVVLISTAINYSTFAPTVGGRCVLSVCLAFLLFYLFDSGEDALAAFVSLMRFFAISGALLWVVFVAFGINHSWMPIVSSSSNSSVAYYTVYIFNILQGATRNCGPFWEPSIYAGFLMVGMIVSRFILHQKFKSLVPFILALLTSQSSGGIMMLCIFFILCLWDSKPKKKSDALIPKLLVILLMVMIVILWGTIQQALLTINYDMFSKLINAATTRDSETRLMSFVVDFRIWLESPVFGVGVSAMEERFLVLRDIISKITNMAHTSTSSEYLAAFGLGGLWINYLWFRGIVDKKRSTVVNVGVVLIFFLMLNEAPQINFVLTYFVLFALLRIKGERLLDSSKVVEKGEYK